MKRKLVAVCTIAILSGAGVLGFAGVAAAEETPPEEGTVVETLSAAPVDDVPEEKLAICHSGSGAHWSYIAPDASGYNGHQHHDADIYGLTEAECLAKNPVVVDEEPVVVADQYAVIIWSMEPSGETPDFDPDQTIVDSAVGLSAPDLSHFDELLVGKCVAFQIDVYKYNVADGSKAQVDYLISSGVLFSPGNPAEPLIAGGFGTAWKFYVNTDCSIPVQECETSAVQPTSTNLSPNGWSIVGGDWVDGGVEFSASDWSDAYATKTVSFPLSAAANLDFDVTGGSVWAIILATTAGNVHYEPEPYSDDLWTNAPGILPANAGGQGGPFSGGLDDLLSDPTVTDVYLYFTSGSADGESGILHSGSFNCVTQPFDHEDQVTPVPAFFSAEPTDPTCDVDGSFDFSGEFPNVTVVVTPEYDGPGTYTVTADTDAGYTFPDGTSHKELEVTVDAATGVTQSDNPEGACYLAPPEEPEEPVTPVTPSTPQGLAHTGVDPLVPVAGALALLVIVLGTLAAVSGRRPRITQQ